MKIDFTIKQKNSTIWLFMIPLILSGTFQSLYSLVNAAVVGRVISMEAVAVIGACSPLNTLISHLFGGMAAGMSVYLGRSIGSGKAEDLGKALSGGLYLVAALTIPALLAGLFPSIPAAMANVSAELMPGACRYLRYLFLGAFLVSLKGLLIGLFQGFGDSRTSSILSVLSVVSQTLLVLLLVGTIKMGVEGSALAILLNNALFCLALLYFYQRHLVQTIPRFRPGKIDRAIWMELLQNGMAKTSMMLIIWTGSFAFQRQVNLLPSAMIAAHTYARSITTILTELVAAFGTAAAVMVGQNYATQKEQKRGWFERIRTYHGKLMGWGLCVSLLVLLLLLTRASLLLRMIAGQAVTQELVESGAKELRFSAFGFPGLAVLLVDRYSLQAMGRYRIQPLLGLLETLVNFAAARFVVTYGMAAIGLCTLWKWLLPGMMAGVGFVYAMRQERQRNEFDDDEKAAE